MIQYEHVVNYKDYDTQIRHNAADLVPRYFNGGYQVGTISRYRRLICYNTLIDTLKTH